MRGLLDGLVFLGVELWFRLAIRPRIAALASGRQRLGRRVMSFARPRSANAKYAFRKVFDRDPRFPTLSDKLGCKAWIDAQGTGIPTVPVLWTGTDPRDIPDALLSGDVVLKPNHGAAMNVIIRDGDPGRAEVERILAEHLAADHGTAEMEWTYGRFDRKLLAEPLLFPGKVLIDLRVYVYAGRAARLNIMHQATPRRGAVWQRHPFSDTWGQMDRRLSVGAERDDSPLTPAMRRAIAAAERLGRDFDHLRCDFMLHGEEVFHGEVTLWNLGGYIAFVGDREATNETRHWDLRRSWFLTAPQPGWKGLYAGALRRWLDREAVRSPYLPDAQPRRD